MNNIRTYTLTFNNITLDTTNLRMEKRGGKEVIDYFLLDDTYTIQDGEITDADSFRKAIESSGECRIVEVDRDKTTVEVTLELDPIRKPKPPTLECMKTHYDGAHCGLGDWYKEIQDGIQEALDRGPDYVWTTGWYSSKKECASARITNPDQYGIEIEVSVSNDNDTEGLGKEIILHTTDLDDIRDAIYIAWDEALAEQAINEMFNY